jgi:hypothetical protein
VCGYMWINVEGFEEHMRTVSHDEPSFSST